MENTLISLIILAILFLSSLTWLVTKTIKEGREALKEINNNIK